MTTKIKQAYILKVYHGENPNYFNAVFIPGDIFISLRQDNMPEHVLCIHADKAFERLDYEVQEYLKGKTGKMEVKDIPTMSAIRDVKRVSSYGLKKLRENLESRLNEIRDSENKVRLYAGGILLDATATSEDW